MSFLQGQGQKVNLGRNLYATLLDFWSPSKVILCPMLSNIYMCPLAQLFRTFLIDWDHLHFNKTLIRRGVMFILKVLVWPYARLY